MLFNIFLFICIPVNFIVCSELGFSITGSFDVEQTIFMFDDSNDPVGYKVSSKLVVTPKGPNVYLMKLHDLGLNIMSRKAPTSLGFISHSSKLETAVNKDFLIEYEGGMIKAVHLSNDDSISIRNIKRAVASAFQFNTEMKESSEKDSSGDCLVNYEKLPSKDTFVKNKRCISSSQSNLTSSLWSGDVTSESGMKYIIDLNKHQIMSVVSSESHKLKSHLAEYAVARVEASLELQRTSDSADGSSIEYTGSRDEIISDILVEIGGTYSKYDLTLEPESTLNYKYPQLEDAVKESRVNIADYGSVKSAEAVLRVANAMMRSNKQQIYKVLNSKDNKKILGILVDIAGSIQSHESHQAVLKKLKINTDKYDLDMCERYFWALSLSPKPSLNITKEVVSMIKEKHHDRKLFHTILQTGAAMVQRLNSLDNQQQELMDELIEVLKEELNNCDSDDEMCRQQYLYALGQTGSRQALPILIKFATMSTQRSGVSALKAIEKLGISNWTPQVFKLSEQVLMSEGGFDSSSRAIALDIFMSQRLSDNQISKLLSLLSRKQNKEINQLLLHKLSNKASKCDKFALRLKKLMNDETNWDKLATGALSTSFSRYFMTNGFLSTDQEISNGILKRGLVHVNIAHNNSVQTLFTLGLFSTGLNSFVSSGEDSSEQQEEEETSAGMQIQLLGVDFRPFVFFTGTGDLMGHVWSGTASTKTPAYQAGLVVSKGENLIPVGPAGVWANLRVNSATSLELAGLIEVSLWNRNAHSAVYNRLGLLQDSGIAVNTDFVETKVDLKLTTEPSLDLTSQIDFGSSVNLCLKLYQPSIVVRYNTYKIESIIGSKHKLEKVRNISRPVPGKTYSLNQKNNEMCNAMN